MKKIGMGLVGPGFVAGHHIDAVRRLGDVDVVAIAGSSQQSAEKKAREYKVDRAYGDYKALIADPDIQVIHNTTPNHLHLPVTLAALQAGKHVISDKPLALNAEEGRKLRDAAVAAKVAHVVTFNYRGNPLVQQARGMVARGETGPLSFVHGYYLQDWMSDPNVYSWRSDPAKGGVTSALGDIGSHWCDLAEHVSRSEDRFGAGRPGDGHSGALFLRGIGGGVCGHERRRPAAYAGKRGRSGKCAAPF